MKQAKKAAESAIKKLNVKLVNGFITGADIHAIGLRFTSAVRKLARVLAAWWRQPFIITTIQKIKHKLIMLIQTLSIMMLKIWNGLLTWKISGGKKIAKVKIAT